MSIAWAIRDDATRKGIEFAQARGMKELGFQVEKDRDFFRLSGIPRNRKRSFPNAGGGDRSRAPGKGSFRRFSGKTAVTSGAGGSMRSCRIRTTAMP
ncbi:MAG: hypothetical protein M1297_08405 [Nitrospirae bacterium]|nr:hypothetical protein [Nitrospirota bacterium]